jgi:hypothetical protein
VPVLTTYQVNIWREIKDAGAGIIHHDTQAGADMLLSDWLAASEDEKAIMRARARECFAKNFEMQNVVGNLMGAIEHVASSTAARHTFRGSIAMGVRKQTE